MEALEVFSFCSFVLGMLTVSILVFISRINAFSRYVLAISFFSLSWLMLTNYLTLSQNIYKFPHFFRTASPLTYLIFPCGFLYVRSVLRNEKKFRQFDWVHFLPAFLHMIELMPFYVKDETFKREVLGTVMNRLNDVMYMEEGLLPTHSHMLLKVTLGLIYVIYQFRIIHIYMHTRKVKPGSGAWYVCNWLRLLTMANTAIVALIFIVAMTQIPLLEKNAYLLVSFWLCLVFMLTLVLLFFKPRLLYGYVENVQVPTVAEALVEVDNSSIQTTKKVTLSKSQLKEYRAQIEKYLADEQPYLQRGFSARDMETATKIPRHHLSMVINTEYGMHFNDLINEHRVDYVKNNLNLYQLEHLTIEAVAEKAGFNSRTTFFHAVKKFTGQSPSSFIKTLKQQKPKI